MNKRPAKRRRKKKNIVLNFDDCCVIKYALARHLKDTEHALSLLKISKDRPLTKLERLMLPENLQRLSDEELRENVDPWITLVMHIKDLIEKLELEG